MNFKKKLLPLLALILFIMPLHAYAYSDKILVGGQNIGISIVSKEITIVGFYKINDYYIARDAGFKIGDAIVAVNDTRVSSISEMISEINKQVKDNHISITVIRNNEEKKIELNMVLDDANNYKTGIYVKDQINGIGTLTFIDPNTKIFGALGHEIVESSTNKIVDIKDGKIFKSNITGTIKSTDTTTGEKNAVFYSDQVYGKIHENTTSGIFGIYQKSINNYDLVSVGNPSDIKLGSAQLMTVLKGDKVEAFDIEIQKINPDSYTKNILFEITDAKLIDATNGVIKGMSGSPIIQDGKIIGAVTHAIVNDNNRGYGIFITTMLKEGEN